MTFSKRLIPYVLYGLVLISSLLVGLSLDSNRLIAIAVIGATLGFLVADVFKLFKIQGVLANIASIVILLLAMKDFLPGDSTGKLISVANLLVYLQTVLMFQEKTPRLNWQILILSLLQVVVAAIFSLDFEAGLLFMMYFFAVAIALLIQSIFSNQYEIRSLNESSSAVVKKAYREKEALTFFEPGKDAKSAKSMALNLGILMVASLVFTCVMFSQIPRNSRPWFGPARMEVASTGASKSVDLDERDIIKQSGNIVFRVEIIDNETNEAINLDANPPYFRGIALSSLVIEDDKTTWRAPHDRVYRQLYQQLEIQSSYARTARQKIQFEESSDPLVYPVMPTCRNNSTLQEITFCHEISAITRCHIGKKINTSPFMYEVTTLLTDDGAFSQFWPYLSNMDTAYERPMSDDRPQHEWLTQMDVSRYPVIVRESDKLLKTHGHLGRMELLKQFELYFNAPFNDRFTYTLDFRKVKRDESVDPVEDFFANHKSGHCELFASALTLMLRKQNIPARVVLGFHGAEKNGFTGDWIVRGRNAHAWVEAYLRPEDCTDEMLKKGLASEGGAWLRLDPTPSIGLSEANVGEEAIDLARTVWDDYVLGNDQDAKLQDESDSTYSLLSFLDSSDFQNMERQVNKFQEFTRTGLFKYGAAGVVGSLFLFFWYRGLGPDVVQRKRRTSRIRRFFAGAISLISPELGKWVMDGSATSRPTAFYESMTKLLAPFELAQEPCQTHREFADEVVMHFDDHPKASMIRSSVCDITRWFNEVRFGKLDLNEQLNAKIGVSLDQLRQALAVQSEEKA